MATSNGRNLGIDILRAVAILMVFFSHGLRLEGLPIVGEFHTGVDLFFLLSGFLIGRIFFRHWQRQSQSVGEFWMRRWWRTLPPYYVALGLYALASLWVPELRVNWRYLTFTQNYGGLSQGFNPSWSLCVEEHFYLLLPPLVMLAGFVFGRQRLLWVLCAAFFVPMLLRIGTLVFVGHEIPNWFWMTHMHCEGMILGVLLAYLFVEKPHLFAALKRPCLWALPLLPLLLLYLTVGPDRDAAFNTTVFTLLALAYAPWLRVLYDFQWTPKSWAGHWTNEALTLVAITSYSVYLVHLLFFGVLGKAFDFLHKGFLKKGLVLVCSYLLCLVFYYAVERTTLLLRDHYMRLMGKRPSELKLAEEILPTATNT